MKNTLLTTTVLVFTGTLSASAIETWIANNTWMQSTNETKYEYSEGTTSEFYGREQMLTGTKSNGISTEVKHHLPGTIVVDGTKDARYHITFELGFYGGNPSGNNHASGILSLVSADNQVSLLLGNDTDTMCRLGCILGSDVNATPYLEHFTTNSTGKNHWTAFQGNPLKTYTPGEYQYHLIFETFADNSIDDKVFFGVECETTGKVGYFSLNLSQMGMGGANGKVWDDIGFNLVGSENGGLNQNTPGVMVVGNENGVMQSKMTTYTRTATKIEQPAVPEPSAFGLLAGIASLALVAARRKRK